MVCGRGPRSLPSCCPELECQGFFFFLFGKEGVGGTAAVKTEEVWIPVYFGFSLVWLVSVCVCSQLCMFNGESACACAYRAASVFTLLLHNCIGVTCSYLGKANRKREKDGENVKQVFPVAHTCKLHTY